MGGTGYSDWPLEPIELVDGAIEFLADDAARTVGEIQEFNRLSDGMLTDLDIEKLPGQVRMALGDFTATNLVGPVRLTTRSRDVHISDFTNSLELTVERGDIELRPGKLPVAKMDVHAHFG